MLTGLISSIEHFEIGFERTRFDRRFVPILLVSRAEEDILKVDGTTISVRHSTDGYDDRGERVRGETHVANRRVLQPR